MIREKEIEEYIPKGMKTKLKIDDCFTGFMANIEAYGCKVCSKGTNHLCFKSKTNEPLFVLLNVTDILIGDGELLIYYGKNNRYVSVQCEPT